MRNSTLFCHIATARTPFIYFHLLKYNITNLYDKLDIAPIQKFLKMHCLRWIKMPVCLEHGYLCAVNMGSDYEGILFTRQSAEVLFLHKEA